MREKPALRLILAVCLALYLAYAAAAVGAGRVEMFGTEITVGR